MIRRLFITALLTTLLFSSLLFGQNQESLGKLILDIQITGNVNIETELIQSLTSFQVGDLLQNDKVSKSLKDLYQLGVFDNINITTTIEPQGVIVHMKIIEYPIVQSLTFNGNEKINTEKLQKTLNLRNGSYWSPFLARDIKKNIKEQYKEKGYHLADVEFVSQNRGNNLIDLTINISEGNKVVIGKINIFGNKDITSKKLLGKMKTKKRSLFRSGKFEQEKFDEDLDRIIDYYNKKGFIDSRILSWEKRLEDERFIIDIYLFEGNSYYFGDVFVTGNNRFTDTMIKDMFRFNDDEVFNREKFEKQLQTVRDLYHEEGYIYFFVSDETEKEGNKVNIILDIQENNRAKIREISFKGNRKTKDKVIIRHLAISPGDYYRQSSIQRTMSNIYNMGFFEPDLYPEPQTINENGDIDIVFNLNDRVSGSANGGVALNSEDGLVGQLAVSHNNLFGNSWQSSVKWEFGGSTQNFNFSFTNPYFMDTSLLMGLDVYFTTKEWETFELTTNGGSVRFGRPVPFLNYGQIVAGYSFYSKKYRILDGEEDNASDDLIELDQEGWQQTSSVSITFSRDSRDNSLFPTTGSDFSIYNEIAGGPMGGDFDYFKQIIQVSWFTKTLWELSLRTKWRFGYVTEYNDSEVPPDERFYLGGTGVDGIRGYSDNSVGPDDGGLREILFSTEYAAPLGGDQIIGLLFLDAGNSYNSLKDFNFWEMKKGAGIGIRIRSPFGLIGFDYAHNFEDRTWEPHFQFGTTF